MEQGQGAMGMNAMGNNYGGYPSAMTRNGKQGYCSGIYMYIEKVTVFPCDRFGRSKRWYGRHGWRQLWRVWRKQLVIRLPSIFIHFRLA